VPIPLRTASKTIRTLALSFPEAYEDSPWGFPVFKVADNRMFALLQEEEPSAVLTVKLGAEEREIALLHPWVRVASYVGRYGWVTATIEDEDALATALEWLRESYYLKAPKTLRDAAFPEHE
jgi:predicted DNA-binding protein (MmcQ/YjbR family)